MSTLTFQQMRDIRIWAVEVTLGRHAAYNAAVATTNAVPIQWLTTEVVAQAAVLEKYILSGHDATTV